MDIFPLEQGELLVGYRGRLAAANNCQRPDQVHRLLAKHFPPPADFTGQGIVPGIANSLNIPQRHLLQEHTVYPLFAAFPDQAALEDESRSPFSDSYSTAWLRMARPRIALCPTCAEQDMDTIHISYWRRAHQLPGLFHCPEHGTELLFMALPPLLSARPHELLQVAQHGPQDTVNSASDNPIARRCIALLQALFTLRQTASLQTIRKSLRTLAFSGLTKQQEGAVIGDVSQSIAQMIPAAWLTDLMPNSKGKRPDRLVFVVAALRSDTFALSAAAVALLLSVFDVPENKAVALIAGTPQLALS